MSRGHCIEASPDPLAPPPAAEGSEDHVRPARVLVVEDNPDAAQSLADVLELQGHRVWTAKDGVDGLTKAHEVHPQVILCDIGLPDIDGYEFARRLRADGELRTTTLVAVSGYALPEDKERARAAGFDAHMAKPPDLDALVRFIAAPSP